MEVILNEDVERIGIKGEIVRVADGFYRNYLQPRGLAVQADRVNKKWLEAQQRKAQMRHAEEKEQAEKIAEALAELDLRIALKAGENEKLYGSVTSIDVAAELKDKGYDLDRRKIQLSEPIKKLGMYTIPIRIHPDVEAKVNLLVEAKEE